MSAWGYEPGVLILVTFFMTIAVLGIDLLETGWIKLDVGDGSTKLEEDEYTSTGLDGEVETSPRICGSLSASTSENLSSP